MDVYAVEELQKPHGRVESAVDMQKSSIGQEVALARHRFQDQGSVRNDWILMRGRTMDRSPVLRRHFIWGMFYLQYTIPLDCCCGNRPGLWNRSGVKSWDGACLDLCIMLNDKLEYTRGLDVLVSLDGVEWVCSADWLEQEMEDWNSAVLR
ncbi:hypothetical protein P171DRAFT_240438 [Karstenula rhodostoma CBS 690.94]|uniref:Uncharacterized protein n=1 Tax=Karstenula rhodostoma CBS 690.94 TaxID=1392251 RepID=A0A9P4PMP0_9PLEO|nr:hypothetical protein P171DRAFT_240438 [Karstenula rhodostoma CBS 690.94]